MLKVLAVHGYRSLRDVVFELGPLTVVRGERSIHLTFQGMPRLCPAAAAAARPSRTAFRE